MCPLGSLAALLDFLKLAVYFATLIISSPSLAIYSPAQVESVRAMVSSSPLVDYP